MSTYPTSWEIHPDKQPDLTYDDWHRGFSDADDRLYPQHPHNQAYMMGWLECFGMDAGYANQLLTISDETIYKVTRTHNLSAFATRQANPISEK